MADRTCSVDGCEKPAKSRGWCNTHYERWRRTGDAGDAEDARRRPQVPCLADGCDALGKSRGLCNNHYQRCRKHGDPLHTDRPTYGVGRRLHRSGYILVWAPDHPLAGRHGYVLEHRMVVWDAGIELSHEDHVHHRNHDKTDNRLENLEVLTASEHARVHLTEAGMVRNQYGDWKLGRSPEEPVPGELRPQEAQGSVVKVADAWLARTSWAQWPVCSRRLGLR